MQRRYSTLDGLRGVGALWVVLLHFAPTFGVPAPAHGYLAVDLFFCLSGFVLSRSYAGKIEQGMRFNQWLMVRLIRLYPLFFLSIVLGFIASDLPSTQRITAFITGLLMLPSPTWATVPEMFPLNFVAWSLFIEMMLSILFFWSCRWKNGSLWTLLALGLAGLIAARYFSGYIGGGFAWRDAPSGFARGLFGFVAGMLIARYSTGERKVTNAAWLPLLVAGIIMSISPAHAVAYDLAMIVVGMPALVFVSVRLEPLRARPFTIAGDLSYAIYAFHSIGFSTFERLSGFNVKAPASPVLGLGALALFLAGCWLLDRYYDCPIRRRLSQSIKRKPVLVRRISPV